MLNLECTYNSSVLKVVPVEKDLTWYFDFVPTSQNIDKSEHKGGFDNNLTLTPPINFNTCNSLPRANNFEQTNKII